MFVGWLPLISAENYADICDTVSGRYVNICQWRVQHFFNASIHLVSHENSVFRNSLVNQAAALLEPLVRMSSCIFHCSAIYCHLGSFTVYHEWIFFKKFWWKTEDSWKIKNLAIYVLPFCSNIFSYLYFLLKTYI